MAEDDKKFPNASEGVAGLLNIDPNKQAPQPVDEEDNSPESAEAHSMFSDKTVAAPSNLPVADLPVDSAPRAAEDQPVEKPAPAEMPGTSAKEEAEASLGTHKSAGAEPSIPEEARTRSVGSVFKSILPYAAIFAIGLGLYFFYFSDFSLNSIFNSDLLKIESLTKDETNKEYEQLKKDAEGDYRKWLSQFFVDINDDSIISMDADVSGNGLSNFEKYLLNLNPKVYATRGGVGDGQLVLEGINPWTGKQFTDKQKALVEKYINPELISNRITAAAITRGVTKYAQYVNDDSPYYIDPQTLQQMGANGQIIVSPTQIATTTLGSVPVNTQPGAGNPGPGGSVAAAPNLRPDESIDQSKPGLLEIPSNKISVPLIWTQDVKNFDPDLKKGVVHYPGTAMPGEVGTAYISGHSSGYLWDKSPYKQIFAVLGDVKDGTSFTITATQKNGKTVRFNYVVERRGEYAANDQAQFISTADSVVALSTCWPVGTTARRLVLFGKLTQTERS
ncbi:sortase [bacterium]|nr:MAG: sortase [bacterium]